MIHKFKLSSNMDLYGYPYGLRSSISQLEFTVYESLEEWFFPQYRCIIHHRCGSNGMEDSAPAIFQPVIRGIPRFFAWGLSYSVENSPWMYKIIDSKAFHISGYPHLFGAVDPLAAKIHAGVVASGWHSPRSGWRVATCDASYGGCEVDWDTTPSGAQPNADARDRRRCQLEDLRSGMFLTILGGLKIRWVWVKVQMIFVHPPK